LRSVTRSNASAWGEANTRGSWLTGTRDRLVDHRDGRSQDAEEQSGVASGGPRAGIGVAGGQHDVDAVAGLE
jgi:hypothetical protein